jgi:hypothetical protein
MSEAASFDVDGFGRSFFSDAGRCRVGVVDTAGNEVCWFGAYGNPDDIGAGVELRGARGEQTDQASEPAPRLSSPPSPRLRRASRAPRPPDIPFAWPQAVAVGDAAAYVNDRVNQRIVAVKLGYRTEASCPVP